MRPFRTPLCLVSFALLLSACTVGDDPFVGGASEVIVPDCHEPRLTTEGKITGALSRTGQVCAYMGVPYAKPPVDTLRFAPPEPPAPRTGTLRATQAGSVCIQKTETSMIGSFGVPVMGEEDCLFLNIWRPAGENLPVMVFIHGGAFVLGAGSWAMYDADHLAQEGVVVVTINYRMGPLGFMASPALQAESPDGSTGNQGIQDQMQALRWVRDNIASFGGDPDNVTIFGESAGAMSVCTLLTAPAAEGLFHKAIMQSGACTGVSYLERGYANAVTFAEQVGCERSTSEEELACMRGRPVDELMDEWTFDVLLDGLQPHVDGVLVPDVPLYSLREGKHHDVPMLAGSNADEVRPVALTNPNSLTLRDIGWDVYFDAVGRLYPEEQAREIESLYGPDHFENAFDSWYTLKSDFALTCPTLLSAEALSERQTAYHYLFAWSELGALAEVVGAVHGLELFLLFGNYDVFNMVIPDEHKSDVLDLSAGMRHAWAAFARDGTPSLPGRPAWPTVEEGSYVLMAEPRVDADIKRAECDFWDELLPIGMDQFTADVNAIVDEL